MPKNVLILGMPRSGTSLTANVFVRKGYHVGESSLPYFRDGDDHNPFGYFEADDVVERNVELFRRVGYHYYNTWRFEMLSEAAENALRELVPTEEDRRFVEAYDLRSPWVWKDQRLCFTLPYWWKLMDPSRVGVLLIRRNPRDVHLSFQRMGWSAGGEEELERVRRLTGQHLGAAEAAIRVLRIPHIEVDYAEYSRAPREVARRIGDFFGLELTGSELNVHPELDHSRPRGRAMARLRLLLKRLPRGPVRRLERLLPHRAVAAVFPERRYLRHSPVGARAVTEELAREDLSGKAEQEVAARLRQEPLAVAVAARLTWGRSLSSEYERRLALHARDTAGSGGDSVQAQVTDELIRELTMSLAAPSRR